MTDVRDPATRVLASRWWWGALSALIVFALVAQIAVTVSRAPDGVGVPERLLRFVSYFTIQSNILVAGTGLTLVLRPDRDGAGWRVARLCAVVGATVTGIVYLTVLRGTVELAGWSLFCDYVFHYVCPIATVVGWLLFGPRPRVTWRVVGLTLLWPLGWLAYTLVHGEIRDWYPYPFVDVNAHGYAGVTVNCLVVTAVVMAVASLYRWADGRLAPAPHAT